MGKVACVFFYAFFLCVFHDIFLLPQKIFLKKKKNIFSHFFFFKDDNERLWCSSLQKNFFLVQLDTLSREGFVFQVNLHFFCAFIQGLALYSTLHQTSIFFCFFLLISKGD